MNGTPQTKVMREIPPEWERLMQVASAIGRGRATVIFNEGRPVQVEVVVKKIILDNREEFEEKLQTIPFV